jgi:hypothetical protein
MSPQPRRPEDIRASIEDNRRELGDALERLRAEVTEATDWRQQLRTHQQQAVIGAAAAGFVVGGGIGGFFGLFQRS